MRVNFKRLIPEAVIPTRADTGSAGYDLYVPASEEYGHILLPGETYVCKLGFAIEGLRYEKLTLFDSESCKYIRPETLTLIEPIKDYLPTETVADRTCGMDYMFIITPRSGNAAKRSLGILNAPGIVDANFRGNVGVILHNHSKVPIEIHPSDKIAQMILVPYFPIEFVEVEELGQTDRGDKGFGSSGIVGQGIDIVTNNL